MNFQNYTENKPISFFFWYVKYSIHFGGIIISKLFTEIKSTIYDKNNNPATFLCIFASIHSVFILLNSITFLFIKLYLIKIVVHYTFHQIIPIFLLWMSFKNLLRWKTKFEWVYFLPFSPSHEFWSLTQRSLVQSIFI